LRLLVTRTTTCRLRPIARTRLTWPQMEACLHRVRPFSMAVRWVGLFGRALGSGNQSLAVIPCSKSCTDCKRTVLGIASPNWTALPRRCVPAYWRWATFTLLRGARAARLCTHRSNPPVSHLTRPSAARVPCTNIFAQIGVAAIGDVR